MSSQRFNAWKQKGYIGRWIEAGDIEEVWRKNILRFGGLFYPCGAYYAPPLDIYGRAHVIRAHSHIKLVFLPARWIFLYITFCSMKIIGSCDCADVCAILPKRKPDGFCYGRFQLQYNAAGLRIFLKVHEMQQDMHVVWHNDITIQGDGRICGFDSLYAAPHNFAVVRKQHFIMLDFAEHRLFILHAECYKIYSVVHTILPLSWARITRAFRCMS